MTGKQEKIIQTQHMPSGWFLRWAAYGVASVSYLFGLFLVQRTLASFLLLTGTYGVWLMLYQSGRRRANPCWLLVLICPACASLFIPLPSMNEYWLPILPTMTACVLMTIKPR